MARPVGLNRTTGPEPVAVKLANTVGWRFDADRRIERLPDAESLLLWSLAVGVLSPTEAELLAGAGQAALEAEAGRVRELREAAYAALAAGVGEPPPPAALTGVHRAVAAAIVVARPAAALPLTWDVPLGGPAPERTVGHRLAIAVAGTLASPDLSRIGRCGNEPCGWLFVDATRSRTRRWCSSTGCGNSERARRHYARRRDARRDTPRDTHQDTPHPARQPQEDTST